MSHKLRRTGIIMFTALSFLYYPGSSVAIVWDWSVTGFNGTLETTGTTPVSGTYTLTNFELTSSSDLSNFPLGSISGGQYQNEAGDSVDTGAIVPPQTFTWDAGSNTVTSWSNSGTFGFALLISSSADDTTVLGFGVNPDGTENSTMLTIGTNAFDFGFVLSESAQHNLAPRSFDSGQAGTPEPSTFVLAILGLLFLTMTGRRRRRR